MKAKDYNRDWSSLFKIDESSDSGLVWNCPQYFKGTPNYKRVGQKVGSVINGKKNSYWTVGIGGEGSYLIHRILWVMVNGSVEIENDIDHLDGNGLNNKLKNLRCVPKSINSRNKRKRADNKSGVSSVVYLTTRTSSGYQANFYKCDGSRSSRFYSEFKYGYCESKRLAVEWLESIKQENVNAGYTERHGC